MKYVVGILCSVLCSCSSLPSDMKENVHEGDTKSAVIERMGDADGLIPIDGHSQALTYKTRKHECAVVLENDKVVGYSCRRNASYVNPAAAMLTGMGNGLQNASSRRVNCTTTGSPGAYYTNCY